jgi:hypothetical protein
VSDLRILGVAVQLVLAVLLVGFGVVGVVGRLRPARVWDRTWGRTPRRVDGAALAVLGLGVGAWALTQTTDLVPLSVQLGAIAVVVLGAVAVVAVQTRIPDEPPNGAPTDPPTVPATTETQTEAETGPEDPRSHPRT